MNLPRPPRSTLTLSLCLAALAGTAGYQQYVLQTMRGSLDATAEKASIDALLGRVNTIDERLDSVAGQHLVTNDDFRAGQQALSNRIDAAQAYAKQASDAVQQFAQTTASVGELQALKADLETLSGTVQELRKPPAQPAAAVKKAPAPKPVSVPKPKPKPEPAPEPPPFHIVGVEYRGGERFLSIAPPGSTRLSQIYLIRPGDVVAGTAWRLRTLDDRTARFDAAGVSKTISLQP
ncbi:hypothetical protein [Azotobacter vinelandii]|uniref:hypothetical protein n=1 Tax=Azotobacter vinelandii TaxID=354 RepID=UPI000774A96B|nr:hypothetical protein [Azotobacter vinelandii]